MTLTALKRPLIFTLFAALGFFTSTAEATATITSPTSGVAYGILACTADGGSELRVALFDFTGSSATVEIGQPCVPFVAQLKSSGFQVGAPVVGLLVPGVAESLIWEIQGSQ